MLNTFIYQYIGYTLIATLIAALVLIVGAIIVFLRAKGSSYRKKSIIMWIIASGLLVLSYLQFVAMIKGSIVW